MTTTHKPFDNGSRHTLAKDAAMVALTAFLVGGFLFHAWRPEPSAPKSVQPAVFVAAR